MTNNTQKYMIDDDGTIRQWDAVAKHYTIHGAVRALYCAPDGLCEYVEVELSWLRATDETREVKGWGPLDGDCVVCTGTCVGEYLLPAN